MTISLSHSVCKSKQTGTDDEMAMQNLLYLFGYKDGTFSSLKRVRLLQL